MPLPYPARITKAYEVQYSDPLELPAGAAVEVGHDDPTFPGWKWCTASDGRQGWVPLELLSPDPRVPDRAHSSKDNYAARLLADYSARELAVHPGEPVTVEDARHAWLLVRNAEGQRGWIPASHAEAIETV